MTIISFQKTFNKTILVAVWSQPLLRFGADKQIDVSIRSYLDKPKIYVQEKYVENEATNQVELLQLTCSVQVCQLLITFPNLIFSQFSLGLSGSSNNMDPQW